MVNPSAVTGFNRDTFTNTLVLIEHATYCTETVYTPVALVCALVTEGFCKADANKLGPSQL